MSDAHAHVTNPLHGITLERMLTEMVEQLGWARMGRRVKIQCFLSDPSVSSSLKFLRRTPWARAKVEAMYLEMKRSAARRAVSPPAIVTVAPTQTEISTRDGTCRSFVFRPAGVGPWPAVLMFMDGVGIRPAMLEVAERLSTHGYLVLLPDLFYRTGPYEPMNAKTVFVDPAQKKRLYEEFFAKATLPNLMSDTQYFLDWIAAQPDVRPGPVGTTGYCMGGAASLSAAGTYPDRIAAAASYHGGRLATDAPDSPHLKAATTKARVYVAGAIEDASFPDDMKARLEAAYTEAGVPHLIETYQAKHGWVLRDFTIFDQAGCERHWMTLVGLMDATLKA